MRSAKASEDRVVVGAIEEGSELGPSQRICLICVNISLASACHLNLSRH